MKYQLILLLGLLSGIRCRSIIFPNVDETDEGDNDKAIRIERSVDEKTTMPSLDLTKPLDSMNLLNFNQEFVGRSNREKHVQPRFTNTPSSFPLLEKLFIDDEAKIIRSCAEQINGMLLEIQNALSWLRKYLDEWCRKHRTTMKTSSDLPASPSSDAN